MTTEILTQVQEQVNFKIIPAILIIRVFDKKGQWQLEVIFEGGTKVTGPVTQDEVTAIEHDLYERGWQIDPSLFCAGFNAKPGNGLGRWWEVRADALAIAELDEPLTYNDEELIFASSADQWPDDYAIESYV